MLRSPINLFSLALLSAVPAVGFWQIFTGTESFFVSYDNVNQFYPWYQKLSQAIHHGYLPIWDANALSGHSFAGEFQTGIFYPVNIIWVALFGTYSGIGISALEWLVIFHYFIASIFAFLLARKLSFNVPASVATALLYAYTGDFADRASGQTCIFFGNAYLPLAFYFAITSIETCRLRYAAFAGISVGLQVLAGHLEPPSIGGLLVVTVLLIDGMRRKQFRFSFASTLTFIAFAVLSSLPQLFFGFQYLSHAYRWVMAVDGPIHGTGRLPFSDYAATAFSPAQILNVIDPRNHDTPDGNLLFIGCLPVVVLLIGFASTDSRKVATRLLARVVALVILASFAFLMLLGPLTPLAAIVYHIPFAPAAVRELGRYAILVQLLMVLAVGAVLNGLESQRYCAAKILDRRWEVIAIAISVIYIAFVAAVFVDGKILAGLTLVGVLCIVLVRPPIRTAALSFLIAIEVALELPGMAKPTSIATYASRVFTMNALLQPAERCYPECRLVILDDIVPANIGDVYPIQTFYGKGATMYEPYYDLLGAGGFDPHGFVEDVLDVRYIISGHQLTGFRLLSHMTAPDRYLYERPNVFPRVFSLDALEKRDKSLNDIRYKIETYSDLEAEFLVAVPRTETVVFSEQFYPGWVVSVDGHSAQMLAAGIVDTASTLRAVSVATGEHRIRFDYPR